MFRVGKYVTGILAAFLLTTAVMAAETININTADEATLDRELIGIGPAKAKAIVTYREKNGPFKSVEELGNIPGIGEKIIESNRANIRLTDEPATPVTDSSTPEKTTETPPAPVVTEAPAAPAVAETMTGEAAPSETAPAKENRP